MVLSCVIVMPVMGLRLSLCTAGVLQLLLTTGILFSASALHLTSKGKTFWRVAEELSWSEALEYCWRHHTDLANLHSMSGWSSLKALYSLTSSREAWVGLFFNAHLGGLRWSSGSSFSASVWGSLPAFREGLCATLYSVTFLPSLGAAWCTALRPFICYYDPTVGPLTLLEPVLSLTATPKPVEVQLGNLTFKRFDQEKMWLEAVGYCRRYHTDLADLQTVTEEMDKDLKSITSNTEAWIGLYFSVAAGLRDPTIGHRDFAAPPQLFYTPPSEVTVGMMPRPSTSFCPAGAMKGRASAGPFPQQVSPEPPELSSCTLGPSTSASAGPATPQPRGTASPSPPAHVPIPGDGGPWTLPVTAQNRSFGPAPPASSSTPAPSPAELVHSRSSSVPRGVTETPLASTSSSAPGSTPSASLPTPALNPAEPIPSGSPSVSRGVTESPQASASSPAPREDSGTQGGPGRLREAAAGPSLGSTGGAFAHPGVTATPGAVTSSGSRGAEPPGTEESTAEPSSSGSSAVLQRTNMRRKGPAQSQAAGPETAGSRPWPDTAVTSGRSGTNMTDTAPATQAPHWSSASHPESKEKTPARKPGQLFGILKADFLIPVLMDPEDMKDQFLREIQDVLNLTLGHQQFRLKWAGFEVNKK